MIFLLKAMLREDEFGYLLAAEVTDLLGGNCSSWQYSGPVVQRSLTGLNLF